MTYSRNPVMVKRRLHFEFILCLNERSGRLCEVTYRECVVNETKNHNNLIDTLLFAQDRATDGRSLTWTFHHLSSDFGRLPFLGRIADRGYQNMVNYLKLPTNLWSIIMRRRIVCKMVGSTCSGTGISLIHKKSSLHQTRYLV